MTESRSEYKNYTLAACQKVLDGESQAFGYSTRTSKLFTRHDQPPHLIFPSHGEKLWQFFAKASIISNPHFSEGSLVCYHETMRQARNASVELYLIRRKKL